MPRAGTLKRKAAAAAAAAATQPPPTASSSSITPSVPTSVYRLKVSIAHSTPLIWRRLLVRSNTTLRSLHHILQLLFEWQDEYVHRYRLPLPGPHTDDSDDELPRFHTFADSEWRVTLSELLPEVSDRLLYEYGPEESWGHVIEVEAIEPATQVNTSELPQCTGGQLAAPVDDEGGMDRHMVMVYQYRKMKGLLPRQTNKKQAVQLVEQYEHDDTAEQVEGRGAAPMSPRSRDGVYDWLEDCSNRALHDYDPLHFDQQAVNRALQRS